MVDQLSDVHPEGIKLVITIPQKRIFLDHTNHLLAPVPARVLVAGYFSRRLSACIRRAHIVWQRLLI